MEKKLKVYIAGPMRGIEDQNKKAFFDAESYLVDQKIWDIFNPSRIDNDERWNIDWLCSPEGLKVVMARDLEAVCQSEVVYMLTGWEKSEGARIEHSLATMLGLCILYQ
jgi:hypothetical protein